jgi:hypothetical protein
MKRTVLIFCLFFFGCSTTKTVVTEKSVINQHPQPIKVFGIGYWTPGYTILTLVDADKTYFTIKAKRNDLLKVGDVYRP